MSAAAVVDPSLTTLPLNTGPSMGVVVISLTFAIVSLLLVCLRLAVNLKDSVWSWDDTFLVVGTAFYMPDTAFAVIAAYRGLGHVNAELNAFLGMEAMKWYYLWIIFYVIALLFVKTSVCLTILKITGTERRFRWGVWSLIVCSVLSFLIVFLGLMFYCKPLEAAWDPSRGTCAPLSVLIALSYASTVGTIITDAGCAILPAFILWKTQMRLEQKLAVCALLSFASFASITTVIRTPYINHYTDPTNDLMFWVAHIVLFSNVETGIGCIAASLPTIRKLWIRSRGTSSQNTSQGRSTRGHTLVTIGGTGRPATKKNRSAADTAGTLTTTVYAQGEGDWDRLDGSSDKELVHKDGIRAEYSFAVEMQDGPKHTNRATSVSDKEHP